MRAEAAGCKGCRKQSAERRMQNAELTEAAQFTGRIAVVLPVRNEFTPAAEGNKLLATVEALRESVAPGTELRFAVFDDASHDNCAQPLANCPLVHPWARRAPSRMNIPPMKPATNRPATDLPLACHHTLVFRTRQRYVTRAASAAPITMPRSSIQP